jgi:hypothetical protein
MQLGETLVRLLGLARREMNGGSAGLGEHTESNQNTSASIFFKKVGWRFFIAMD